MITEKKHEERLKNIGLNIKTKYKSFDDVLERNTDGSKNDNIPEGVRIGKDYYYRGQVVHKETLFDSRILYKFEFNHGDKEQKCPNCGSVGTLEEFNNGCPYCGTHYNLDYDNKDLGGKYYYDRTLKGHGYVVKTLIIDLIVSFIVSLWFISTTSRTFTIFDMSKVLLGTVLIGAILFFVFYYLDAAIILSFVRAKKDKLNKMQIDFWNRMNDKGITKNSFYNNLNFELRQLYYGDKYPNVVDYDILDYNSFRESEDKDGFYITVNLDIRLVEFKNGKVKSDTDSKTYKFKRAKVDGKLDKGVNIIQCHGCGASIDVTKGECEYCGVKNNYLQEWYLVDVDD